MPLADPLQTEMLTECSVREPLARFAHWLVEELELPHELEGTCCRVTFAEDESLAPAGHEVVAFCLNGSPSSEDGSAIEPLTAERPFFQWLCQRVRDQAETVDARPCQDPRNVYELSERLFPRYRVDGGGVHLSGCALEDHPFLRLTYPTISDPSEVVHFFFTPDGAPADAETRGALGLAEVCHRRAAPPHFPETQLDLLVAAGIRVVQSAASHDGVVIADSTEPLAATVVWVKRAIGKLQFTIGNESVEIGFEGWARTLQPPPFVCPHTGTESYHVAATDDGRIAAAEVIEPCAETGRRVLATELVSCSVTGKRVLPEFTRICPISGQPAMQDQFAECAQCRQQVSGAVLAGGVCDGCRKLASVPSDDPHMVWILSEHPRLGEWGRWRISETAQLFIVTGGRFLRRILLVLDKETLAPRYAATRGRFRRSWLPLDPTEQQDFFGERTTESPD